MLILACFVVIIVVATGGKKSKNNGNDPNKPKPNPDEPNFRYNPYQLNASSLNVTSNSFEGLLVFSGEKMSRHGQDKGSKSASKEQTLLLTDDVRSSPQFRVASERIPVGTNNKNIEKVRFRFAQSGLGRSFLELSDENDPARWDIPEEVVPKDKEDSRTQLASMSNFEHGTDQFWFRMGQRYVSNDEVLVDTEGQAFVMQDKFMQIDMKLPTQKIFGFGERQREFGLGEGAYTMWANGQETPYDDGTGGKQVYGVHPFCLVKA